MKHKHISFQKCIYEWMLLKLRDIKLIRFGIHMYCTGKWESEWTIKRWNLTFNWSKDNNVYCVRLFQKFGQTRNIDGGNETGGTFVYWLAGSECVKLINTHKGSLLELVFILQLWLFPLIICLLVWEISHDLQQEHPWTWCLFYTKLKQLIC